MDSSEGKPNQLHKNRRFILLIPMTISVRYELLNTIYEHVVEFLLFTFLTSLYWNMIMKFCTHYEIILFWP